MSVNLNSVQSASARIGHAPSQFAVALTEARNLKRLPKSESSATAWFAALESRHTELDALPDAVSVSHLHFGNEFCERLLPEADALVQALETAARLGVVLVLSTPMLADTGIGQLRDLLRVLPDGAEVVANDFGVLRLLQREFPALRPVAGRMLCKAIKDPRLPSETWARLYPSGVAAPPFVALLQRLGVIRMEMDVAPFARTEDYADLPLPVAVHAPFGYSVKGRICRPGSLHQAGPHKFAPNHHCHKECLVYRGAMQREGLAAGRDLHTFQRGNTLFYRHSPEMQQALSEAIGQGWVERLVIAGDWHENHRSH